MQEEKVFLGDTEEEIWKQVAADLNRKKDLFQYRAVLQQGDKRIVMDIDIDLGGGFDSGYEFTRFMAPLKNTDEFKFSIRKQGLIQEAGKLLGMQDVVTGFAEFDEKVIVKTNDEHRVKVLFAEEDTRSAFLSLADYSLKIREHKGDDSQLHAVLELEIEEGITSPEQLRELYHAFISILRRLDTHNE